MSKPKTPRSDAAAKRALEKLQACHSEGDFAHAIKSIVGDLIATSRQLEVELNDSHPTLWMDEALNSGDGTYKP